MSRKIDVKIGTKEEAFWENRRFLEERMIQDLENDIKNGPKLLEFHRNALKFCEEKVKEEQEKSK